MRTFDIPFSFVSSPETEKERLLYTCENVASGFYQKHGFLTCPEVNSKYKSWSIVIPPEIRKVSKKFWQDAYKYGVNMRKEISPRMYSETKNMVPIPSSSELADSFKNSWKKYNLKFWIEVEKYFKKEIRWIESVEVRITKIGSLSSHYLLNKTKGQKLVVNLREDAPVHEIANLIILALIFPLSVEYGLTFTKRQALRNFIMSRTEFKKLFPDFKPKIYDFPKIPVILRQKSDGYIGYLGIPNIIDPIKLINQNIHTFGTKETKILKQLIDKNGELLTYDDLADLIWGEGKFKSYWAINKLIQRINNKIKKLDIIFEIKGVRGVGYKI